MLPRVTALALIVLLCSSCGFKPEPTGALPAYPQTVRDALGRQVHIDTAPRRIVSLDPGMTAALYRIGAHFFCQACHPDPWLAVAEHADRPAPAADAEPPRRRSGDGAGGDAA